jgi:hypothetical protein
MTAASPATVRVRLQRAVFALAILAGSFLLFLIQPMVARMALPVLGGAPNVWNSAMLVYQLLLLGGYGYAHLLSRWPARRQAWVHLALAGLAALTLPIALADLPPPRAGWEALWAPALIAASVGPVFVIVAAQASLLQRWFAETTHGGDPYALYAASNLGSLGGLLAYPLWLEPRMALGEQSGLWALGYLATAALLAAIALRLPAATAEPLERPAESAPTPVTLREAALWFALAAVPSGLMLSTTTLLTTDIMAMPLLWVIPLGLYLLSYTVAFSESGDWAAVFTRFAPVLLVSGGSLALVSGGQANPAVALVMAGLLFAVAVALHRRLYELRPDPARLTLFYLVVAAGGAAGGSFVALVAPLLFDWTYEHAVLLLAAAALLPMKPFLARLGAFWRGRGKADGAALAAVALAAVMAWRLAAAVEANDGESILLLIGGLTVTGALLIGKRWAFAAVVALAMLGHGGAATLAASFEGQRARSYFGSYAVANLEDGLRQLTHGTTVHGSQWLLPERRSEPTSYYGRGSGIGLVLTDAARNARVGVVGLGAGTLACYRQPGQTWTFFEIDPLIAAYSRNGTFSYLADCAPDAQVAIGDARLRLARKPSGAFDVLAVDAFSSDAIPIHLMTREAFATYGRALADDGVLAVHISNRFIDLAPMVAAQARAAGWTGLLRYDEPGEGTGLKRSIWIVLARDGSALARLQPDAWEPLPEPALRAWTDDNASILPLIRW